MPLIRRFTVSLALLWAPLTASPQPTTVESGGWQISWDDSRGVAHHSERPASQVVLYEQPKGREDCDYNEVKGRVLSVVGDVVSIETDRGWYCGGAHPGHVVRFDTIDLSTGARVDIRRLVPETILVAALKQDDVVRAALDGRDPEDLDSLIGQTDGGCEVSYLSLATSFAFYEIRDDQVSVRFGLSHGCEVMRGAITEIEIELPVPRGLDIDKANAMGLLMKHLAPDPLRRSMFE